MLWHYQTTQPIMSLQIDMITQIDQIGRKKLIDRLKFCAKMVKPEDKVYFDNLVDYFNKLYKSTMPDEKGSAKVKKATEATLLVIHNYNSHLNCRILGFTETLIQYKLDAMRNNHLAS